MPVIARCSFFDFELKEWAFKTISFVLGSLLVSNSESTKAQIAIPSLQSVEKFVTGCCKAFELTHFRRSCLKVASEVPGFCLN